MSGRIKIKKAWNHTRFYLSFLLLAFYLIVGSVFLFTEIWADLLPKGRTIAGLVIIGFGILRFYVAWRRFINKKLRITTSQEKKEDTNAG